MDTDLIFLAGFASRMLKTGSTLEITDPVLSVTEKMPPSPPPPSLKRTGISPRSIPPSRSPDFILKSLARAFAGEGS